MVVVLLLFILLLSAVLVRIAAFALELTGMAWEDAKFQALSAFTNSGFTTRSAEQVMTHPVRRRIVTTLILLGNASRGRCRSSPSRAAAHSTPCPRGRDRLIPGDSVIVYGAADAVQKVFKPRTTTRLTIMGMAAPDV